MIDIWPIYDFLLSFQCLIRDEEVSVEEICSEVEEKIPIEIKKDNNFVIGVAEILQEGGEFQKFGNVIHLFKEKEAILLSEFEKLCRKSYTRIEDRFEFLKSISQVSNLDLNSLKTLNGDDDFQKILSLL